MAIERMTPRDWSRVRTVRLRSLAGAPDAFGTTLAEDQARPPEAWQTRLASTEAATWLAVEGGVDVGMIVGAPYDAATRSAGLFGMWVDPEWRGRGTAEELVQTLVRWARAQGYARVVLDVGDHNEAATGLYRRCGFERTGETSGLPPPRESIREHQRALTL